MVKNRTREVQKKTAWNTPRIGVTIMLSLCMIVMNEERSILRCLESVKEIVEEMVIVDTGSSDRTIELIEWFKSENPKIKVKLLHFDWVDDFAKARNFALDHATKDFIFVLDADEYILKKDVPVYQNLIKRLKKNKLLVHIVNFELVDHDVNQDINETRLYKRDKPIKILRLFSNRSKIRYSRRLHESIKGSMVHFSNIQGIDSDIKIYHDGYDSNLENFWERRKRNLRILGEMIEENNKDDLSFYYFAREYTLFDREKGLELLKKYERMIKDPHVKRLCKDRYQELVHQ